MTPKSCLHLVSASPRFWAARVDGGREDAENGMDLYEVVDFYIIAPSPVGPGPGKGKRDGEKQRQVGKARPEELTDEGSQGEADPDGSSCLSTSSL